MYVYGRLSCVCVVAVACGFVVLCRVVWLRTNGVNTNGAAAKVMIFDRLRKKVRPGTFGKIRAG